MSSSFSQYVAILLLNEARRTAADSYSGSFASLANKIEAMLGTVEVSESEMADALAILTRFAGAQVFDDPLTGGFFKIDFDNFRYYFIESKPDFGDEDKAGYSSLREALIRDYPVLVTYAETGIEFADAVVQKLKEANAGRLSELKSNSLSSPIPASNRIVSIDHNRQDELVEPIDKILEEISSENAIDGDPNLLQIIKGQLDAGRALIQAGCFKLYALEVTLIEGLKFLAKRYEKEAVGALAATLLAALVAQFGTLVA